MSSALIFIVVLGVLVVIHEFGHFMAAKFVGIRVDKFSIGFGPVIFGKKWGGTEFCVSLLPLGGFVKLAGESPEEATGGAWEFNSKNLGQKFLVVLAGPLMNAFLAFVLFSGVFLIGQPVMTAKIGKLIDGSPAKAAGVLEGDRITAIDGEAVATWEAVLKKVRESDQPLLFTLERGGKFVEISVTPKKQELPNIFGKKMAVSVIGIAPSSEIVYVKSGFWKAVSLGAERVWMLTVMIFYSLGLMFSGALSFKDSVTGPIGIFFMTQEAARMGIVYLLYFTGSLSVSLFVLNLLPIPVLDGGHVLFMLIEKIKGSPLKESVKERMTQGGLTLLLILMAFVIFQDVNRYSIIGNVVKWLKG